MKRSISTPQKQPSITKTTTTSYILVCDACCLPFPDCSIDLVFSSPPYVNAKTYGIDGRRDSREWAEWMLKATQVFLRVCRGPVLWGVGGVKHDRFYWPGCEGLVWESWKCGGEHHLYRPCFYHRVGICGSGGDDWFRSDVEFIHCFKRLGPLPSSDNTVMGHPPKRKPGGGISHRLTNGRRRNKIQRGSHRPPEIAGPGNLISVKVGGGHMAHALAHENRAPFPEALAEFFVRSLCPPKRKVLESLRRIGDDRGRRTQGRTLGDHAGQAPVSGGDRGEAACGGRAEL
jgi:hypothetical protein